MKIIAGNANPLLAQEIADYSFAPLVPANISTFADGEISVEFLDNIEARMCLLYKVHQLLLMIV